MLDTETTGLHSAAGDRICEVAIARTTLAAGGAPEVWSTLVDPGRPMPRAAERVHGISDGQLVGAPRWGDVQVQARDRLDGAVLIAHNAAFDVGFLDAEARRAQLPSPVPSAVLCTLQLARRVYGFHACSLRALASRAGVPQPMAHRALADVQTTLGVLRALIAGLSLDGEAPTLGALQQRIDAMRPGGPGRAHIRAELGAALLAGRSVVIDYTARFGDGPLTTRRRVTPTRLRARLLDAWCHLRGAERTFQLKRVQRLVEG